jgi:hypothetical protein
VHDTVLAIHLLVAPDKAVLIQSRSAPALTSKFVSWLEDLTRMPITLIEDDDLLAAAQVSLGSLGVVFSVVMETVRAYKLLRHTVSFNDRDDPKLWNAIKKLESSAFYPDEETRPYHFEVLFNPYPVANRPSAHLTLMWKKPAGNTPAGNPDPVRPALPSDTIGLIKFLADEFKGKLDSGLVTSGVGDIINNQMEAMFRNRDGTLLLPGQVFGPTTLPRGNGASTEIVINHDDTERTVHTIWKVLQDQANLGKHLFGAMSLRFVPASKAHLAMNIHPMNCYIELPSIMTDDVKTIYPTIWNRLEAEGIPYTCHWGQLGGMNPSRVEKYFKGREVKWKTARATLLDATGCKVFTAPLLAEVGLE